jgi:hypothetical protein
LCVLVLHNTYRNTLDHLNNDEWDLYTYLNRVCIANNVYLKIFLFFLRLFQETKPFVIISNTQVFRNNKNEFLYYFNV